MPVNDAAREEVADELEGLLSRPRVQGELGATLQLESAPWAILVALDALRADPSPACGRP